MNAASLAPPGTTAPAPPSTSLSEPWGQLVADLDTTLAALGPGSDWRPRLFSVHGRARHLFQRQPDASLYQLVYEVGHSSRQYSCHHALLVLLMAEHAAEMLGWPVGWIDSLGRAALTMNVAMRALQDELANSPMPPSPEMREQIDGHAEAGAALLESGRLADPLCVAAVRRHHDVSNDDDGPLTQLPAEEQLARLLRRVDIFAAKISRRATRRPVSPVQAAREACLGTDGMPDEIGGALLKAVGLYPPGSFVELTNGEVGIVLARGKRANTPCVAVLAAPGGNPLPEPLLRDTFNRRYAVRAAVASDSVRARPPHEVLLVLR